jgi:4-hydroxy-tetrahydrodipicolinate synthase
MSEPLFTGVAVPIVSLFDEEDRLLADETGELAAKLAARGVRAIVVAGTTGEAASLTAEDRVALVKACKRELAETVPVLVGTGAATQDEAIRLTEAVLDSGADATLTLSPAGVSDCRPYYEAVVNAAKELPVLGYHFPAVSSPGIALEYLNELPIVGLKDSSGDADRLVQTLATFDRPLYVGSATYLSLAGPLGATGAILALANVEPEQCAAAFAGDIAAQRGLVDLHLRSLEDFPLGVKMMVAERYRTPARLRAGAGSGSRVAGSSTW